MPTDPEPTFAEVDAYVAALEDAAFAPLIGQECPSCGGSGYATTMDGRELGTCSTCNGYGGVSAGTSAELEGATTMSTSKLYRVILGEAK